jgi:hypothetical protein
MATAETPTKEPLGADAEKRKRGEDVAKSPVQAVRFGLLKEILA